jgi:hypothetical protein
VVSDLLPHSAIGSATSQHKFPPSISNHFDTHLNSGFPAKKVNSPSHAFFRVKKSSLQAFTIPSLGTTAKVTPSFCAISLEKFMKIDAALLKGSHIVTARDETFSTPPHRA